MDVPDTDGVVFIKNIEKKKEHIGQFVNCKIIEVQEYDLIAQLV